MTENRYSLIVGIENSLVGAMARREATPRALSGFSIIGHHACRHGSAGSCGQAAWREAGRAEMCDRSTDLTRQAGTLMDAARALAEACRALGAQGASAAPGWPLMGLLRQPHPARTTPLRLGQRGPDCSVQSGLPKSAAPPPSTVPPSVPSAARSPRWRLRTLPA
ncbi:hypothetical protein J2W76_004820 [Methylorubrum zatmanii]|nr:hypothetical protein [Methylorubrum zatmanii]MCP1556433.1 hypothetical protein [Methylorubrum extorquens]MCP1581906.1 hypothetical protein [Methylorubrum extorquens]